MRTSLRLAVALLLASSQVACSGGSAPPAPDVSHVAAADPGTTPPVGWAQGPFMEIYVRGYQDSDGDGIGDLRGVLQRLDYLHDLGVSGIWLMPVTRSQDRDHGYAVTDYRNVERDYGSLADLDALLAAAHARGMGVILDYVMNHSAFDNPLFQSSTRNPSDPYRDWYVWSASHPAGWSVFGGDPWRPLGGAYYYAPFWDQMPDFNLRNADAAEYHRDNLRFWLNRGVDGFRFDAVGQLFENGPTAWADQPESIAFMGGIRTLLDGYARRYMVCEGPGNPFAYGQPDSCGSAFAFGHNYDLVTATTGDPAAIAAVANFPFTAPAGMATLVSNHDTFAGDRLWDQVGGDQARYKLAAATYLLQPGVPFIYYGEELGLAHGAGLTGDWALRTPMSWTGGPGAGFTTGTPFRALSANFTTQNLAAEQGVPDSLHTFYKEVIALRRAIPALAAGSYDDVQLGGATMAFLRSAGPEHALVVFNYGAAEAFTQVFRLPAFTTLKARYPPGAVDAATSDGGWAGLILPARSFAIYTY